MQITTAMSAFAEKLSASQQSNMTLADELQGNNRIAAYLHLFKGITI